MIDDVVVVVVIVVVVVRIVVVVVGYVDRGLVAVVPGLTRVLRRLTLVHGLDGGHWRGRRGGRLLLLRDGGLVNDIGDRAKAIDDGQREGDVAIGGVREDDHAVAAHLVLAPVVPLVLEPHGAGVIQRDVVAVAEALGGIPVSERGVVTDHSDVGGGALELELDAHLRGDAHSSGATGGGPRMGAPAGRERERSPRTGHGCGPGGR